MRQSPKLGFSLIELSIVILIIGILVIGITKGSRIVSEARLKSARSLTASSPVASIPNLTFWIEATSQSSFDDSERVNTAIGATGTITNWYDINPQSTEKNSPTQGTSGNKPRYIANAINGLPAVNFDGSDDVMTFSGTALGINGRDWTVYAVTQVRESGGASNYVYIKGASSTGFGLAYYNNGTQLACYRNGGIIVCGTVSAYSAPKPIITMMAYKPWLVSNKCPYYVFGRGLNTSSATTICDAIAPTDITTMSLGSSGGSSLPFKGDIAEVIIFNRALSGVENSSVQEYLKNKWGVKL